MNLIEIYGPTPTRYALNVVQNFLGENFNRYVCTDNFKKPYNSDKIPMCKEHVLLLKSMPDNIILISIRIYF